MNAAPRQCPALLVIAITTNPNGAPGHEALYRERRFTASFMHLCFPSNPDAGVRLFLP